MRHTVGPTGAGILTRGAPRVDAGNECIWWGDRRVALGPKAFQVLRRLMQQPNQIVTKGDLLDAAWPDTHVSDGVLKLAINQLRAAFDDDVRQPRFIETVHRRGYRWVGGRGPESSVLSAESGSLSTERGSLSTQHPGLRTDFVGRDAVLAELERCYAQATTGQRQLVFVTGEAGIGKTAVLDAFVARRRDTEHVLLAHGQCVDGYGASEVYLPLLEAVERLCRASASGGLVDLLRRVAPTWLLQLPRLLTGEEHDELRRVLAGSVGDRMVRELLSFTEELTADRTLVLVLEDLHWSDHATIAALAALAARRDTARLLIVATYRPADSIAQQHPVIKLKYDLAARGHGSEIALQGLPPDEVGIYLARRFPDHHLPVALAPQLQAGTSGNPLFMLNALADFVQRGWLEERDGTWECTVDLPTLAGAVPDGTREMIAFRLQQLSPADLELLETASVIGASFATQGLAAILDRAPADIEAECARLADAAQFIAAGQVTTWPDGRAGMQHLFRHALYQQVLYGRVTPARRQVLHRRVAECLEQGFAHDAETIASQLALHCERGGDLERAVHHRRKAAAHAVRCHAYHQAIEQLRFAIADLAGMPAGPERDAQELRIYSQCVEPMFAVATMTSGSAEFSHVIERLQSLSARGETTPELLQALATIAGHNLLAPNIPAARSACVQMVERAEAVPWGNIIALMGRSLLGGLPAGAGGTRSQHREPRAGNGAAADHRAFPV